RSAPLFYLAANLVPSALSGSRKNIEKRVRLTVQYNGSSQFNRKFLFFLQVNHISLFIWNCTLRSGLDVQGLETIRVLVWPLFGTLLCWLADGRSSLVANG